MDTPGEVLLVALPHAARAEIDSNLRNEGYTVATLASADALHEVLDRPPPQCMIFSLAAEGAAALLADLKNDSVLRYVPALALVPEDGLSGIDWRDTPADDYLMEPLGALDLLMRVRLCILRSRRDLSANPLTGLPGNTAILNEAERRLANDAPFSVAYLDIDNFKPFNDKYGFSRGDEVLRMTARVIVNAVRAHAGPHGYAGHVGGDDYIFMAGSDSIEKVCEAVVQNFDMLVPNFYDNDDRAAGCIRSVDRQNNPQEFPLMGCSIAVVDTQQTHITSLAEISTRTAELKKLAKALPGSNYLLDRRK